MENTVGIPRVSVVEPLFNKVDDREVCTRTWEESADPKLNQGDVVDVGGTACNVLGKVSGTRFVTYQFSPADL